MGLLHHKKVGMATIVDLEVGCRDGEVGSEVPCCYSCLLACSAAEESETIGRRWDKISDVEAGYQQRLMKALPVDLAAPYAVIAAIAIRNTVLHVLLLAGTCTLCRFKVQACSWCSTSMHYQEHASSCSRPLLHPTYKLAGSYG